MKVIRQDDLPFSNIAREFVVVPPDTWHSFTATGDGRLRMTSIQPSPSFATEWKA
jgi:mannose-6-phosphate isomerase-like protein (cupin superfamily)